MNLLIVVCPSLPINDGIFISLFMKTPGHRMLVSFLVSALASLQVELGSGDANTVEGSAKVPVLVQLDLLIHGCPHLG